MKPPSTARRTDQRAGRGLRGRAVLGGFTADHPVPHARQIAAADAAAPGAGGREGSGWRARRDSNKRNILLIIMGFLQY